MSWDGWFTMPLGWVLVCAAMIGSCVLVMGRARARSNSALHSLDERFARGELGDDEYKATREAILSL
jgi:putative membrane protein